MNASDILEVCDELNIEHKDAIVVYPDAELVYTPHRHIKDCWMIEIDRHAIRVCSLTQLYTKLRKFRKQQLVLKLAGLE